MNDNNFMIRSSISIKGNDDRIIPLAGSGKIVVKERYQPPSRSKLPPNNTTTTTTTTNGISNNNTNITNTNTVEVNDILLPLPLPSYFRTIDSIDKNGNSSSSSSSDKTLIQVKCYSGTTNINENSVKITRIDDSIFNNLRPLTRSSPSPTNEGDFNDDTSLESLAQLTKNQNTIKAINTNSNAGKSYLNDITSNDIDSTVWSDHHHHHHLLLPVASPALASIKKYKIVSSSSSAAAALKKSREKPKLDMIDVLDNDFLDLFDKKTLPPLYQPTIHDRVPNPNPNMGDLIRTISAKSIRQKSSSSPLLPSSPLSPSLPLSPSSPSSPSSPLSPSSPSSDIKKNNNRRRPTSPMTDATHEGSFVIKKHANLDLYNTKNPSPTSAQMANAHNRGQSPLYHPSTFRRPIKDHHHHHHHHDYHYDDYDESIPSGSTSIDILDGNITKQRSTWIGEANDSNVLATSSRSSSPSSPSQKHAAAVVVVSSPYPIPVDNPQLNRTPKSSSRRKKYNPVRIDASNDDDNVMTCASCQSCSQYWCQKCLLSYCSYCWDKVDHHYALELVLTSYQADDVSISPQLSRASTASSGEYDRSVTSNGGDGVTIIINKPKAVKYQDYPEPPIIMDSKGTIHQEKEFTKSLSRSPSRSLSRSPDSPDRYRSESPYGDYSSSRPESPGIYTYDPNQGGSRSLEGLSNSHIITTTKRDPMLLMRLEYLKSLENAKLDMLIKHYESKQSNEILFEASKKAQARAEATACLKQQLIEEKKKRKKEEKKKKKNNEPKKKKRKPKYVPPVAFAIDAGGCTICPQRQQPKKMRSLKNYSHFISFPGSSDSLYPAPTAYPNDRKEVPPPIVETFGSKTVYLKEPLPLPEKTKKQVK